MVVSISLVRANPSETWLSALSVFVLLQLHHASAAGAVPIISEDCGTNRFADFESGIDEYKVGNAVLMCESLDSWFRRGCFSGDPRREEWGRVFAEYCGRGFLDLEQLEQDTGSVDLVQWSGRKLLVQPSANASIFNEITRRSQSLDQKGSHKFWSASNHISLAIPGIFLLCCALLFPCCRTKRKNVIEQTILARDLNSAASAFSSELKVSTERIPESPVRVLPSPSRFSLSPHVSRTGPLLLSVDQIRKATQNFSPSLKLGAGGFGTVYKGVLPDGQIVAVKRARKEYFAALQAEFKNEIELLTHIEHQNLVRLLGYIDQGNEHIIISEFVPNGTLREHLDGQHEKILDFSQRLEIAIAVAHGLTYLHLYAEKPIIHRDVKSSNILLTESFKAKVADFGFAKMGPTETETHVLTQVKGTVGYLDPEYTRTFKLTPKSDVYSFGILLIEIISARRPVDLRRADNERITVRWAFGKFSEGNVREIMDPLLGDVLDEEVVILVEKMLALAFQCAAPTRSDRPEMKEVVEQLWELRRDYGRSLREDKTGKKQRSSANET